MRAVREHTNCKWILQYIKRWLKAPVQLEDGKMERRDKGTPQGGVISPLLANLFLHYAFDMWMQRNCPSIPFKRFTDDIISTTKAKPKPNGYWRNHGSVSSGAGWNSILRKRR